MNESHDDEDESRGDKNKPPGEIEVKRGLGHGLLYKPFEEWVDPAVNWADGR